MTGAMNIGSSISESTRFWPQTSSCTSRAMAMPRIISNPTVAEVQRGPRPGRADDLVRKHAGPVGEAGEVEGDAVYERDDVQAHPDDVEEREEREDREQREHRYEHLHLQRDPAIGALRGAGTLFLCGGHYATPVGLEARFDPGLRLVKVFFRRLHRLLGRLLAGQHLGDFGVDGRVALVPRLDWARARCSRASTPRRRRRR